MLSTSSRVILNCWLLYAVRLAPEEISAKLTGYEHNGVTCIGMKTDIPVFNLSGLFTNFAVSFSFSIFYHMKCNLGMAMEWVKASIGNCFKEWSWGRAEGVFYK